MPVTPGGGGAGSESDGSDRSDRSDGSDPAPKAAAGDLGWHRADAAQPPSQLWDPFGVRRGRGSVHSQVAWENVE